MSGARGSSASLDDFRQIEFGFADAHTEGASAPQLLLDGFLDEDGLIDTALSGREFLFLGYKGSGKSAIAERARLLAESDPNLFVRIENLDQFRYADFKSAAGTNEPQTRYPTVWMWLLLVSLFESLEADQGGMQRASSDFQKLVRGLRELGLLPTQELNLLVTKSSKKSFKVSLPKFLSFGKEQEASSQDLQLSQAVRALSEAAVEFPTESRHVLFLDGLDEVLGQRDLQFQALAALMAAVFRLNNEFAGKKKPFKIVVLCRTDIFDRLPGANMNKLRQDQAVLLNWYDDPAHPDNTRLVRLLNLRARLSLGRKVNVFTEFLPSETSRRDTRKLLLDHTRHIPRDLVRLFSCLQARGARTKSDVKLTPQSVRSGLRTYSMEYFLPEVRNEMYGYLHESEVQEVEQLLAEHGSQQFTIEQLEAVQQRLGQPNAVNLTTMAHVLFDCSVIGYVEKRSKAVRRTVKYRNPSAHLSLGKVMWIHPAACRALDIQPGSVVPPSLPSSTHQAHPQGKRRRRRNRRSR